MKRLPIAKALLEKFEGDLRDSEWLETQSDYQFSDDADDCSPTSPSSLEKTKTRRGTVEIRDFGSAELRKTRRGTIQLKGGDVNIDLLKLKSLKKKSKR